MEKQIYNLLAAVQNGEQSIGEAQSQLLRLFSVSGSLLVSELEEFFYEMGEDWHLWDEEEKGHYPIQRTFDAMKKFIDYHKSKQ